mmetsp:Transcript_42206/g.119774  ORF Transcript_42206/g.119774 Transcript_42206/m.119774 type:complete len:183 (-) Transcript_42206:599-1147(-)
MTLRKAHWRSATAAENNAGPCARVHATFVPCPPHGLLLFGGRTSPSTPLNDLWLLDTRAATWTPMISSTPPPARYRYAMCQVGSSGKNEYVLSGGVGSDGRVLGDVWRLRVDGTEAAWEEIVTPADDECGGPGAVHSHTLAFDESTNRVMLFGGIDGYQSIRRCRQPFPLHTLPALDLATHT